MRDYEKERRLTSWTFKLIITVLPGGLSGVAVLVVLLPSILPKYAILPCLAAGVFLVMTCVATILYRVDSNGWLRSIVFGTVVGIVGQGILSTIGYLLVLWIASQIQLV